jgi:hypothetical protein
VGIRTAAGLLVGATSDRIAAVHPWDGDWESRRDGGDPDLIIDDQLAEGWRRYPRHRREIRRQPRNRTASMTVPIATSPGRSGFGPQLALSYDSGAGNGAFGVGWSMSLPAITRKTDKGLPGYQDFAESDTFILSGAEDLVPVLKKDTHSEWVRGDDGNPVIDDDPRGDYLIRTYRPHVEGLFARIERWTRPSDGDVYWRSISKDNVTTSTARRPRAGLPIRSTQPASFLAD